jgi:hypothetical protein
MHLDQASRNVLEQDLWCSEIHGLVYLQLAADGWSLQRDQKP